MLVPKKRNRKKQWAIACVLCAAVMAAAVAVLVHVHACKKEVLSVHDQFIRALDVGDMKTAYRLMSTDYKAGHTETQFAASRPWFENAVDTRWQAQVRLWVNIEVYQTNAEGWTVGLVYLYTREKDGWRFTGHTEVFVD